MHHLLRAQLFCSLLASKQLIFCCEQFCLSTRTRMMPAPQSGTPVAVNNQTPAAPPTPSPDGTIGESSAGTQQSAALSAAPAAAGTTAVGAGVGKRKQTSSIWRFMQLFVPPDSKGRNVKCIVKIKLPTSVGNVLPARTKTCGALFKHIKGGTMPSWARRSTTLPC